jgi:gamma-glutamyltranspeptidase
MVASSHPLVTQAGLRALHQGGNAVDAALAMAAIATVAEPNTNGLGGDMFAILWNEGTLAGLNGSGRSAAHLASSEVAATGPDSVPVPGALRGWADIAGRYGRFGLDRALGAAAELADRGVRCTSRIADFWTLADDAPWPSQLFDEAHLASRRALVSPGSASTPPASQLADAGTAYLCVVDTDGMAVSLIQSLYMSFGSGVVAPGTGVVLQNRGACFSPGPSHPNALAPRKRPFHTIMPGMLIRDGDLLGPFGVVGGAMQPQAHLQLVVHMLEGNAHPQAALDAPRWRLLDNWAVELEPGLAGEVDRLRSLGHEVTVGSTPHPFGSGQMILRTEAGALVGGSDGRADGYAAGM